MPFVPLISIIIPVYNVEPFLNQCLDSVVNQTYKKLEIILIDDGSTDKSGLICDEYKRKDNRIIVIHQNNQGLSVARNVGLDICKGEYISFIDSDDYVDLKLIEILFDLIAKNKNTKISCCNSNRSSLFVASQFIKITSDVVWGKLYNKVIFDSIRFPLKIFEDTYIITDLVFTAQLIVTTNQKLYFHLIRKDSLANKTYYENNFKRHEALLYKINRLFTFNVCSKYISRKFISFLIDVFKKKKNVNNNEIKEFKNKIKCTYKLIRSSLKFYAKMIYFGLICLI